MFPALVLAPAADGAPGVLPRLFQLYLHDLSEFRGTVPGDDGLIAPGRLEERLATPGLEAFLLHADDRPAGFAMIRPHDGRHVMAEFFVVRGLRLDGDGTARDIVIDRELDLFS